MVCEYLIHDEDVVDAGDCQDGGDWQFRIREYVFTSATSDRKDFLPDVSSQVSYLIDPACVGKTFAAGMTRIAYQAYFPGEHYQTDGTTLLKVATFDPFHLGVTPAPYLTDFHVHWSWYCRQRFEPIENAIQAFQLLRPSKSLKLRITIPYIAGGIADDEEDCDLRQFCRLFKPAHKHLIRGMSKDKFMELRELSTIGKHFLDRNVYSHGLPYLLAANKRFDMELNRYLWAESPEEEKVLWQELLAKAFPPVCTHS